MRATYETESRLYLSPALGALVPIASVRPQDLRALVDLTDRGVGARTVKLTGPVASRAFGSGGFPAPEGGHLRRTNSAVVSGDPLERAGISPAATFHHLGHTAAALATSQGAPQDDPCQDESRVDHDDVEPVPAPVPVARHGVREAPRRCTR